MAFSDRWLMCADCGKEFLWDAGEQAWFQSKGLVNEPKHCKHCRDQRRDGRNKPRKFSQINCDCCGTRAYVPFVPRGIKPVYCRPCFSSLHA